MKYDIQPHKEILGMNFYNVDCMELMKQTPDNYYELAIVDPPYGINISLDLHKRGKSCKKNGYREYDLKDWDGSIPTYEYFEELKRVSKNQIIWGGNYFLENLGSSRCFIFWDKGQRDFSFADGELAWTSFDKSIRVFDYSRGKMQSENKDKFHPTQKPVALYNWLLKNYAKEGDKILDTHMGSGSIAIACHYMGFNLTACELDEEYFEQATERIHNMTLQQTLL